MEWWSNGPKTLPFVDRVDRRSAWENKFFGVRLGSHGFGWRGQREQAEEVLRADPMLPDVT